MPDCLLSRRSFLNSSLKSAAAVSLSSSLNGFSHSAQSAKTNIIFILADDLGYGDLGCYGQQQTKTPNIDRLSAEGTRFTDCYSGSTVCAPSRCCLMTGQHTGHARIRGNKLVPLLPEDLTVAEVLKKVGYTTGIIGKWGLGEAETTGIPNKKGFDEWFGYLNQRHAHNYYPELLWKNKEMYFLNKGEYSHDLFTREAVNFIKTNKNNPFFLYLTYTIPHANNELGNLTKNGMEVPDDIPYSNESWHQVEKNFAAMITRMDRDIGTLMTLLRELNLDENTIVFFTSDNGPHKEGGHDNTFFQSSGPLRGFKRDLYDGGIRVPMIVRWKEHIKAGAVSDQVWAFWDFLPTVCEVAGTAIPQGIDGISMLPALLGEKKDCFCLF
ncbi:MAG: arylsulfatase [Patescibacteria group bacterium]|nr:arylsulfatase [Patescibacteria group bacterium]